MVAPPMIEQSAPVMHGDSPCRHADAVESYAPAEVIRIAADRRVVLAGGRGVAQAVEEPRARCHVAARGVAVAEPADVAGHPRRPCAVARRTEHDEIVDALGPVAGEVSGAVAAPAGVVGPRVDVGPRLLDQEPGEQAAHRVTDRRRPSACGVVPVGFEGGDDLLLDDLRRDVRDVLAVAVGPVRHGLRARCVRIEVEHGEALRFEERDHHVEVVPVAVPAGDEDDRVVRLVGVAAGHGHDDAHCRQDRSDREPPPHRARRVPVARASATAATR